MQMNTNQIKSNNRLLSLDVMRGITIAGMILVNNPGSWDYVYAPLRHTEWNGLTPTDFVFPFFMFIMGISCYASLKKFNFQPTKPVLYKIIKRTILIFFVGILLSYFVGVFESYSQLKIENLAFFDRFWRSVTNIGQLRILGVMQRLALCYGFVSLIAVLVKHKYILYIIVCGLIGYFLILVLGNGFRPGETNIIGIVDRYIMGEEHMYIEGGVDPEGLLSTIPSICHTLIGFCCGKLLFEIKENKDRMLKLFLVGSILRFSGFLLSYGCPINKKIWSPTFVFVTCGFGALLLALLIWIIDINQHKTWSRFFQSFGVNPLAIYVLAGILSVLTDYIPIYNSQIGLKGWLYNALNFYFDSYFASFLLALIFIGVCWVVAYILFKKKIYIKL
jgi:predicted acyltransferase